jgi:hypothetical protein
MKRFYWFFTNTFLATHPRTSPVETQPKGTMMMMNMVEIVEHFSIGIVPVHSQGGTLVMTNTHKLSKNVQFVKTNAISPRNYECKYALSG